MKTILLSALSCLLFLQTPLTAQEANTLFGNGSPISAADLGFFAAPSIGFGQLDGGEAALFNLRTGILLKDKLAIGGYFNTSVNNVIPQSETLPGIYMDYWTVGGFIEYTLFPEKLVHLSFPVYFGYGEVQMDNETGDPGLGEANFFQLEPAAMLELNLHKYARFQAGAGYRLLSQMNYRNFNQSDLAGLTAYAGLKLGLFR